ncbi:MAG: metallophosphoesterase [Gloeomargarita sp. SKYBB_i_bin120]|nr:metallophosphoesterase [Gloeomargarita sp. SKYG98]MCS7292868.1 metallophosphoesterase [Gloeomargarita sp. SKYB120]MDW8178431.1 metallophosphoesterase [Gloeomargarita sp. SKYBB_i_bin120]
MHRWLVGALQVEQVTVAIPGLPQTLAGVRVVQLSDFHFDGLRLSPSLLRTALAATQAAQPDLIALTGDYVTDDPQPIWELASYLGQLRATYGIYAVLGNHDIEWPQARATITQALTSVGIEVLWNQVCYPLGPGMAVVGLADFWSKEFRPAPLFESLPPDVPRLVLSHNPDSAEVLQRWRVDLQLSGHTHGGQIVIPGWGPLPAYTHAWRQRIPRWLRRRIPSPLFNQSCDRVTQHWEWSQGLHRVGNNQLYVNRGLGTYLPGRFGCPPEVTVITLMPACPSAQSPVVAQPVFEPSQV